MDAHGRDHSSRFRRPISSLHIHVVHVTTSGVNRDCMVGRGIPNDGFTRGRRRHGDRDRGGCGRNPSRAPTASLAPLSRLRGDGCRRSHRSGRRDKLAERRGGRREKDESRPWGRAARVIGSLNWVWRDKDRRSGVSAPGWRRSGKTLGREAGSSPAALPVSLADGRSVLAVRASRPPLRVLDRVVSE
jgi:hypothetical protein